METRVYKAEDRGVGEHGWLKTRYSFSFADWYDPSRMGFGKLRALNDDVIAPSSGFPMHSHRDMEIITIVRQGAVTHKDSMGNSKVVPAGEVQVMSAGTGVVHSEYNASPDEPLELFQIWIESSKNGVRPRYEQKSFRQTRGADDFTLLVSPTGKEGSLGIHQDAYLSLFRARKDRPFIYELMDSKHGVYVFVIDGVADVARETLHARDAIGITGASEIRIDTPESAELLIIEVPR